jgi:AcrR family transcriptional regulator
LTEITLFYILETRKTNIVSIMIEEKRNLLKNVAESFLVKGFYKTTMDEIAQELRVSKKTIYKYFPTKEMLLNLIIHAIVLTVRKEFRKIISQDKTSVEKMLMISKFFISMASRVNFKTLEGIKKLGPNFWNTVERLRSREVFANFGKLIAQGQEEGYIKPVPRELILQIYISVIQSVINPDFIIKNEFSMQQAGQMTIDIIFNGVLTEEGLILYKKLKAEQV